MGQEVAVYAIVALATLNLARIWGASLKAKGGCGKCGGCGPKGSKAEAPPRAAPQLVQLQMNLKSKGE